MQSTSRSSPHGPSWAWGGDYIMTLIAKHYLAPVYVGGKSVACFSGVSVGFGRHTARASWRKRAWIAR
ncbi:hypothetical protein HYPSUDRAFT_43700 [Hypholoma sublateritium FD-334 SS-4]|uniref:Uncharacterized protein n=1 Tax=Hypholoma sublateritium (strain FD-334 SS-4) TaxID=945553 RepID=A0A0D2NU27_HYPSF|nr:hypothetical protein HYPSUDRAFT_43700 [Hypholoma sublateritium FD-334 SS-4]